ncbi:MAG TPA: ABC transporter substrate-binding protein [Spirochaetales bacterium]|nr:ABC transporter substrate-binding protein [Spirochaetales bacterium]
MKRFAAYLLVASLVLGILGACKPAEKKEAAAQTKQETIKIGHTVALTGPSATWGQSEANALKMAIEKINAGGGVLGKQLEVIAYDNRADRMEAVNVAKRLIEQDKVVAIIGPAQSGVANAIREVNNSAKVPVIVTTATNPKVTVNDDGTVVPYTFRVCFIDPFQGTVAAQFALRDLNAKTAAVLYDVGDDYSQFLGKYFVEAFIKGGGKITANEAFRSGELDFRAQLGKIKTGKPDVLFIPTMQKEAALAAKQARDLGITATFLGGDGWASPDLIDLAGPAIEGAYFVNIAALEDPAIQDFIKEYKARFNADPVLPNPLMAYDAVLWLADALKRAGSTDGEKLKAALENTKDLPVLTGKLTIDPATHNPLNKPATIQQVKDKKFIYVKTFVTSD